MPRLVVAIAMLWLLSLRTLSASAQNWQPPTDAERCPSEWGVGDERGAANLITPELIVRAARLSKTGEVIELGYPLYAGMPSYGDRVYSQQLKRTDGFGHQSIGNSLYNCVPMDRVATRTGFSKLGIENAGTLIARGVLIDVATVRGVEMLGDRYEITAQDLQDALKRQNLSLETGDAVIIHAGFGRLWERDNVRYYRTRTGLGIGAAEWLAQQNAMIVGSDTCCVEVNPNPDPKLSSPVHQILLVARGIYLVENLKLDELVQKGIHEFAFVVQPLKLRGATGSSVAPVAMR